MENIALKETIEVKVAEGIPDDPAITRLYTPIDVAKEEIWKRWNNAELKQAVEEYLGNDIPEFLKGEPKAVLARSVVSPNREAIHFLNITQQLNVKAAFVEYLDDKFVPENSDKYYLGKLFFYDGKGRNGGDKVSACDVVNIGKVDGAVIRDMNTVWGERFSDFHHRMFQEIASDKHSFFDISSWLATHGGNAKDYYKQYLALFLCHGVLAEVFLMYNGKEAEFFENIIVPAMEELEQMFGVMPLMVPLFDQDDAQSVGDDELHWMHYHESMKQFIPSEFVH